MRFGGGRGLSPPLTQDSSYRGFDHHIAKSGRGRSSRSPPDFSGNRLMQVKQFANRDNADINTFDHATSTDQDAQSYEDYMKQKYMTIPVENDMDLEWSNRGHLPNRVISKFDKNTEMNF